MSDFDLTRFRSFCNALQIDTKELGLIRLGEHLLGTQEWVLRGIVQGLEDGVRDFTTLKCRQIGISTLSLAFDLYWIFKFPGLSGALVMHDDESRDQFRQTLEMYYNGLPSAWKRGLKVHNRNHIVFHNRSRLLYRVAGTTKKKSSGKLGRSAALAFMHATEMSSWGDEEGVASLKASLAESNPCRFYHWESTARGFNLFYDMWQEAKKAVTKRAIFVSFWANQFYRAKRGTDVHRAYWGKSGRMTAEERAWVRDVRSLYDVVVDDEQLAWYRWMVAEKIGDELLMQQEYPPTEDHAFLATGSQFFHARPISDSIKYTKQLEAPDYYRIDCKTEFTDTEVVSATPRTANLLVWEYPVHGAQYVIGADPIYGSGTHRDNSVLSVWRAYADKFVQVAEFCDPDMATYAFAWALCLVAGWYDRCLVNLEITGPGQNVFTELDRLKKMAILVPSQEGGSLHNVVRNIQHYLYRRVDQISGVPSAIHWQTSELSRERMMNSFRDYFERSLSLVRSEALVNEMKGIVREEGGAPGASDRSKDDRVTAAALAHVAYADRLQIQLAMRGVTYSRGQEESELRSVLSASDAVGTHLVQRLLGGAGYKK